MINLFAKLEREKLLKSNGTLLDLGAGNGKFSEIFFKAGYESILVDKDKEILEVAENNFKNIKSSGFKIFNSTIEDFELTETYDGIIASNALPFISSKESIAAIICNAWEHVAPGGFLYFTLFGPQDQWASERSASMSFHTKDEALAILPDQPYYISEDYGRGSTMKGGMKTWHIFTLLYIKD